MKSPSTKQKKRATQIIQCNGLLPPETLAVCVGVIKKGGVVIFPTETVYGMGVSAFNVEAVHRIYQLKGRSYTKPLPIFLSHSDQLPLVAKDIPCETATLISRYWPGPMTLVLKTAPMAMVASHGKDTIAIRIPDHGIAKQILADIGIPLAVTSANLSGKKSFKSGLDVKKEFNGKVDLIIDGGQCELGVESSVIDATHYPFTVLREGALSKNDLVQALHDRTTR